jgi:uncharacterized membrane protein YfcA
MSGDPARARWLVITLIRLAASAGAVLGILLIGRAQETVPKVLGIAIVLSALWMMATVPRALAHRWRSPE